MKPKSTLRAVLLLAASWALPTLAQINFPDDKTITYSTDVGLRLKNQGSKGVLELIGNYNGQEPVLTVSATSNATAAWIKAVTDGRPVALVELTSCGGTNSSCFGVHAKTTSSGAGTAVRAEGVYAGVWATGTTFAIRAESSGGDAVRATNNTSGGGGFAVYGIAAQSTAIKGESTALHGVWGTTTIASGGGVVGQNSANGGGVAGFSNNTGYAIYGDTGHISNGYSGYFTGKVQVIGLLAKGGGSFKIDHPLDPENKYLYHSFVESPDMMNVYNGIVTLDAKGSATVQMPNWFSALNRDFRYQLTSIGQFSPVYVSVEMNQSNQFGIAGGAAGQRISWQVTGIRQDKFANQNRITVEEDKSPAEIGKYLHATAWGQPVSRAISVGPTRPEF